MPSKLINGLKVTRLRVGIVSTVVGILIAAIVLTMVSGVFARSARLSDGGPATTTPIKHLVVIFQENVSFDHYFGTYPNAQNPAGEPRFQALPGTPSVNGLTNELLTHNPNQDNPVRLDRSVPITCDQDHGYTDEQSAFDHGLMDQFVQVSIKHDGCTGTTVGQNPQTVMDYYDGNTVTALWNYAQHFALSDNSYGTTFGPSTPGAVNLISGQTGGAVVTGNATSSAVAANGSAVGDADPAFDACSSGTTISLAGTNVGDLLNAKHITWGWFEGGFAPTSTSGGKIVCGSANHNVGGATVTDYIPHHEPFQYYTSTANPNHLPPTSVATIGKTDQANHQYDLSNFWQAVDAGNMPQVSFLKAPAYEDGHAGYSDPLDEQNFLVNTINRLEQTPEWSSTAVVISYDDSDGWYDHALGPIVSQSDDPLHDTLTDPGMCGTITAVTLQNSMDRCGYGPRLPLMVISPFAKTNFIDNSVTDQTSTLRFIEDNWNLGRIGGGSFDALAGSLDNMFDFSRVGGRADTLFLDPTTGEPTSQHTGH